MKKSNFGSVKRLSVLAVFAVATLLQGNAMAQNIPQKRNKQVADEHLQIGGGKEESKSHTMHPDAQWYPDAGLGLFLHWGISSVRAMNISWPMIPGRPLSEKRIEDPLERERIIREQDYNLNGRKLDITPLEYWSMAKDFNPDDYHPEKWLKKVKDAGFTYVVLTTKHHEGFALWPSKFGNFSTKNYMGGKDLIRPYVEACRKLGLKIGLYYSGPDWYFDQDYVNFLYSGVLKINPEFPMLDPDLKPRTSIHTPEELAKHQAEYAKLVKGQVEELLTNYGKIDLIWFDGKPPIPNGNNAISQERIRELQSGIVINPRMHGKGDFITYERNLPEKRPDQVKWAEFCNPWNGGWPYVKLPYKALGYILGELVNCRAWGINYLLGIGPMANGDLAPDAYENMDALKVWMNVNKEAVYNVKPLGEKEEASVLASSKGNIRYLYLLRQFKGQSRDNDILPAKDETITLKGISSPTKVVYMPTGLELKFNYSKADATLTLNVPASSRSKQVDVVRVTLSK